MEKYRVAVTFECATAFDNDSVDRIVHDAQQRLKEYAKTLGYTVKLVPEESGFGPVEDTPEGSSGSLIWSTTMAGAAGITRVGGEGIKVDDPSPDDKEDQ